MIVSFLGSGKITQVTTRVATKFSRRIPRYLVLFLFRIFPKILGKFRQNFAKFLFAKMFLFRHVSQNSVYLVQIIWRKTYPTMGDLSWFHKPVPYSTMITYHWRENSGCPGPWSPAQTLPAQSVGRLYTGIKCFFSLYLTCLWLVDPYICISFGIWIRGSTIFLVTDLDPWSHLFTDPLDLDSQHCTTRLLGFPLSS